VNRESSPRVRAALGNPRARARGRSGRSCSRAGKAAQGALRAFRLCLCAAVLFTGIQGAAVAAACDPAYVSAAGLVLTVAPTGTDDTVNLQCALDQAVTSGPGATVQLLAGEYKSAQLVSAGLEGAIRGAGRSATVLRNPDGPMHMSDPHGWYLSPPSATNSYPALLTLYGGDVTLADLTIRIVGVGVLDPFYTTVLGAELGPSPGFLLAAVLAFGSDARLRANRIEITGSDVCFEPGENLRVDLLFGMLFGQPWSNASTLEVTDSSFGACQGIFVSAQDGAQVSVTSSRFRTWFDVSLGDVWNSHVEVSRNVFDSVYVGFDVWAGEAAASGLRDSSVLVRNNKFSGLFGLVMEDNWVTPDPEDPTFSGAIACAILGNNTSGVSPEGAGYMFLPGTYGCTVAGNGGTALDLTGGLHTLAGVTRHTGLGQAIAPLLRRRF